MINKHNSVGNIQCVHFVLKCCFITVDTASPEDTHRLLNTLFHNYSVFIRPTHDQDMPISVNVVFVMEQMQSLVSRKDSRNLHFHEQIITLDSQLHVLSKNIKYPGAGGGHHFCCLIGRDKQFF